MLTRRMFKEELRRRWDEAFANAKDTTVSENFMLQYSQLVFFYDQGEDARRFFGFVELLLPSLDATQSSSGAVCDSVG